MPIAVVLGVAVLDPTWALRWGAAICGGLAVVGLLAGGWRPHAADHAVLGLVAVTAASLLWSQRPEATERVLQNLVGVAAIYFGVRSSAIDCRRLRLLAQGFVVGCVWAVVELLREAGSVRYKVDFTAERLALDTASGASTNHLGYSFAAAVAVIVLVWTIKRPALLGRLTCYAAVVLMGLGINQSGTRGAYVGYALVLVWILTQRFFPGRGLRVLWSGVIGLNLLIVTGVADSQLAELSGSTERDTGTLNGRLEMWPLARDVWLDNPLLGKGAGTFVDRNPLHVAAHNALLDLGVTLGFFGVTFFVIAIAASLTVRRGDAAYSRRILSVGAFVAATAAAVATGYWIESPVLWGLLALASRMADLPSEGVIIDRADVRTTDPARTGRFLKGIGQFRERPALSESN